MGIDPHSLNERQRALMEAYSEACEEIERLKRVVAEQQITIKDLLTLLLEQMNAMRAIVEQLLKAAGQYEEPLL